MKKVLIIGGIALATLILGVGIGRWTGGSDKGSTAPLAAEAEIWTCSMHPQIRLPGPGKCPICGMDLIPVTKGGGAGLAPTQLQLSPRAIMLAQIETTPVERKLPIAEVRMVGKIEYDETRVGYITAWVPGRLDRLYVDYTGVMVKKGDHMASLYSPELLTAQEELIQAVNITKDLVNSELSLIKQRAQTTIQSARDKLRLWGLTSEQIKEIEGSATPSDHLTIYSPISGIVVHKNAVEGIYVATGSRIYTVADLSHLWVMLDAYESDLPWIRYGQEVEFQTQAYPGETFKGRISFIDPVLNAKTRTVKVRVIVENSDGRLKPEMFVRATVHSQVAAPGRVMDPNLAGKWISPMHPEIVKDGPGSCDICGMPLVTAESLGYLSADAALTNAPLVIPVSAPLITGKRAVVYVALTNQPGLFEGREIVLGSRAGDHYIVREGLAEGELVVVNGAFKIDSAVQIHAGPSMMNPSSQRPAAARPDHDHSEHTSIRAKPIVAPAAFRSQLTRVYGKYLAVQKALANDDWDGAQTEAAATAEALSAVDMKLLEGESHILWMEHIPGITSAVKALTDAKSIESLRDALSPLSEALLSAVRAVGLDPDQRVYLVKCPMALEGAGARWLTDTNEVRNPYFGESMLRCGEILEQVPVRAGGSE